MSIKARRRIETFIGHDLSVVLYHLPVAIAIAITCWEAILIFECFAWGFAYTYALAENCYRFIVTGLYAIYNVIGIAYSYSPYILLSFTCSKLFIKHVLP